MGAFPIPKVTKKVAQMIKILIGALTVALVAGCARTAQEPVPAQGAASKPQVSLMKGAGNWVIFKEELSLDSLIDQKIELPYQTSGAVVSAGSPAIKRIRVTLRPTPLNPSDRCGMQVVAVTVITTEGKEFTTPAVGHVTDNSDGLVGMRIEVSRNAGAGLVIPANATGTVIFDHDVNLPLNP